MLLHDVVGERGDRTGDHDGAAIEGVEPVGDVAAEVDELLDEAPMAVNRFWKSEVSALLLLLLLDESLDVLEPEDVLLEVDESDCARLEIADARSLP